LRAAYASGYAEGQRIRRDEKVKKDEKMEVEKRTGRVSPSSLVKKSWADQYNDPSSSSDECDPSS
jgi:hypothetical protein